MHWYRKDGEDNGSLLIYAASRANGLWRYPTEPGSLEHTQERALDRFKSVIISHILREQAMWHTPFAPKEFYKRACEVAKSIHANHVFVRNRDIAAFPYFTSGESFSPEVSLTTGSKLSAAPLIFTRHRKSNGKQPASSSAGHHCSVQ